jgi:hypothetical protein
VLSFGIAQAIAFAFGFQNVTAVSESVEGRADEPFTSQDVGPLLEGEIRRQENAGPFVGCADDVEQEFRSDFARGDITQFIQDQEIEPGQLGLQPQQQAFLGSLVAINSRRLNPGPIRVT